MSWATTSTVRSALTVLAFALVVSASVAGPAFGQATPAPTPAGNGSNDTTGTDYPVQTLAPEENGSTTNGSSAANETTTEAPGAGVTGPGPGAGAAAAANTSGNGSGSSSGNGGGGLGLGIPSAGDLADEAVNGTVSAFNGLLADTIGPVFRLPWAIITVRFAPLEATGYSEGLWARPPGLYGQLYDAAMNLFTEFALLFLAFMFVIDWFGNLSPNPRTQGVIDRIWARAGDVAHLLFSWPIAWAHFVVSSALCLAFMPSNAQVIGDLSDYWAQLASVGPLAGLVFLTGPLLVIVVLYLFAKQFGAFIYMLIGIVAYPFLVVMGMSDHWLLGRLGEYAENAREGYVIAAWYPVPTAFVLGFGYWIDEPVLNAFTLGGPIGEVGLGSVYYPLLWLAALYAPLKVFQNGNPARHAKTAALSAGAGGAPGAATGSAAGASSGAAAGSSVVASGTAVSSASQSLPAAASAAETSMATASSTASRMGSGSPGAKALADGGTTTTSASGGSGGAGPFRGSSATAGSGSESDGWTGPSDPNGAGGTSASGWTGPSDPSPGRAEAQEPDGLNRVADRSAFDDEQRYEPLIRHDKGDLARVSTPKDANWLADQGGVENLDCGTDEPLYFRGETDGELYDLRGATGSSSDVYSGGVDSSSDSVRDHGTGGN